MNASDRPGTTQSISDIRWITLESMGILAVFALVAAWPVPDVNESHYLLKALHHWHPNFLSGDFFLESADAHRAFYVLYGWLTVVVPLDVAAWCGRWLTWLLLAVAWQRLSSGAIARRGVSVFTAALYVTLVERTHMAGEWVVGGVESKGFAYALVFFGLAQLIRQRWNPGLMWLGAATAIHVLVGGWSLVAAGVCWLCLGAERPALRRLWPGLMVGAICGSFGLWPAVAMNQGVEPDLLDQVHQIYVFERLPHHLSLFAFKHKLIERHALLLFAWIALCSIAVHDTALRVVRGFVVGAVAITMVGVVLSVAFREQPDIAAPLLRYFWFRLGDAVVPLGVSLVGTALLLGSSRWRVAPNIRHALFAAVTLGILLHLGPLVAARVDPGPPRGDASHRMLDADDWRAACIWIRDHTPANALVLSPRKSHTFKWWARRAEVVNWKDVPQNARDVAEWWQRMDTIHATHSEEAKKRWHPSMADAGTVHVLRMARRYGATYVLTAAEPRLELTSPYRNASYAVYEVDLEAPVR